ncbi:MAG: CRISPR-associated endonuclease Cas1 [Lachnospiraceae bacterium]|nr:CRISPR-associated endonuclease Cas1 [Lachnospiraceae bacterium]
MSLLYINENGAKITTESNRIKVHYQDGMTKSLPIESVESIILLGKSQITTQCMEKCLQNGIPIAFFSKGGSYFGRLMSTGHINAQLQRKQASMYDTSFALELSKRILEAKVHNQLVVLRRYAKSTKTDIKQEELQLTNSQKKIERGKDITQITGHEGLGARYYFQGLSKCINENFAFSGRNRRPPLDPFNSMISLGYSILMNLLYEEIENHGLNPYFGFMHRDAEKHPTLASDLIEEWRAVIVDALAMGMINGAEIQREEFYFDEESKGCYIQRKGLQTYLKKMERKLQTEIRYLQYVDYPVSFRRAVALQVGKLVEAIRRESAEVYEPIRIR